jgi:hypothetical protein
MKRAGEVDGVWRRVRGRVGVFAGACSATTLSVGCGVWTRRARGFWSSGASLRGFVVV